MGTTGQSITLANSIIGVGILAMPFCFQQCGILLASLILLFMGLISRLCCHFLMKSALLARRRNFEFLAFYVFGSAGKMAVELGIIGFLMGTCIAYFVVVGDLGPQIVSKMFNINQSDILRTSIMVIVSLVCVLPLGLLRNVDSLSNVSAATICFYFCLVIKVIAEATTQLPSGEWQRRMELWKPSGVLQCVPIFSMALFCQTQLFEIFESMPSLSLEKMNKVTKNAINICTGVYFTLGVFGYIAFCSQTISGNILMSLSPTMASDVIKLGFVMSLAFSFPLIIFPCRASLYSFLYKKVHSVHHDHIINHSIPETRFRCITVGIVLAALVVSLLIPNIELVLGLVGSTIGVLICIVFPAACFVNVTFKNTNERVLAKGVLILGLVIMVLGTYANLQAAETQMDRYDERYITQEKIDKIVEDFFEKRGEYPILKPLPEKELSDNKITSNVKKDSEVQPPNPIPPELNSIEVNVQEGNINKVNSDKLVNEVLLPEKLKEDAVDKVSESHPKNLRTKLNGAKIANGDNTEKKETPKEKLQANEELKKEEKIKLIKQQQLIETMKQHGEEQKELMQEQKEILDEIIKNKKEMDAEKPKEIKPSNVPKEDANMSHQKLIETIKQHGKEQKELIKEQKEILNEIIKTKIEFEHDKQIDSFEAKKKAVESIKHIADVAIKSIGGVSEKPVGQQNEKTVKSEKIGKLTNDAVVEIAKKTIEAINEIKIESKNEIPAIKIESIKNSNEENIKEVQPVLGNIETNLNKEAVIPNSNPESIIQPENHGNQKGKITSESKTPNTKGDKNANQNLKKLENRVVPLSNIVPNGNEVKHSNEKPQSYKIGENAIVNKLDNKPTQHKPLALAMSDQAKLDIAIKNEEINAKSDDLQIRNIEKNANNDDPKGVIVNNVVNPTRQKREVVDCSQTILLTPADRKICEILLGTKHQDSNDVLPKVDLSDDLSNRLLLDPMQHFGRSLKSFDEDEEKR